jgi:hypothetical protein
VAGRHRLQHVEHLGTANLADYHAVGAHPQGVAKKVALADFALALHILRPGLKSKHVRLLQCQFGASSIVIIR